MYSILLVAHVMITLALIAIILMQNNSGDMGSLSGSSSTSFMSGRAAASFITRATALLGTAFILTSLALGILTSRNHEETGSIMDKVTHSAPAATPIAPAAPAAAPAAATQPQPHPAPASSPTLPRPQ